MFKKLFITFCLACTGITHALSHDIFTFDSVEQQSTFAKLTHEMRCIVCQNQSLAESQAPLAVDLRNEIYNQLKAGQSEENIIAYLEARYGSFIRYKPPLSIQTAFLWSAPILFVCLGGVIIWRIQSRQQKNHV